MEAPAKTNLRLRVLAREEGGYHGLESLFCALSLSDAVTVRRAEPGIALSVEGGVEMGPPGENLAVRAAERFHRETGRVAAVAIHLEKRIPSAAGLGGGSSDAAAVLRALNALHGDPLPDAVLLQLAIELGADVPFFLCGSALALGWSRGERLLALPPLPPRPVLVAHPGVPWPTGEAFRRVAAGRGGGYAPEAFAFPLAALSGWEGVAGLAQNDFEPGAVEAIPVLAEVRRVMREAGAEVAMLAGSGASFFGIYPDAASRDLAEERVSGLGVRTWRAETLAGMPSVRVDPPAGER